MEISVNLLLNACGLPHGGVVSWGEPLPENRPGVYLVSSNRDPNATLTSMSGYEPDFDQLSKLKSRHQNISVDGTVATVGQVADRLRQFWIPDVPVLYVGRASTSLRKRVDQYYSTKIGQRSPHSGGWWLKTLKGLDDLYVHFSATATSHEAEQRMIDTFASAIPESQRLRLFDPERIAPFANVEVRQGTRKHHQLTNFKDTTSKSSSVQAGPSIKSSTTSSSYESEKGNVTPPTATTPKIDRVESQIISPKDRERAHLRIPARSKFAFPTQDAVLEVGYRGQVRSAQWKVNGHRSGTVGLGVKVLREIGTTGQSVWLEVADTNVTIVE